MKRIFLLSPAKVSGVRAQQLLNPHAPFELARRFHVEGLPLAEIFAFTSALYFRGKIAYARRFTQTDDGDVIRIITANAGLIEPERVFTPVELQAFGADDICEDNLRYYTPLLRDALHFAGKLPADGRAILLGSIATRKYRDVLLTAFGDRLVFPVDFVGRGDMSRGGLMLQAVRTGNELPYRIVRGAMLTGKRAPRLDQTQERMNTEREEGSAPKSSHEVNEERDHD